MKLLLSFVILTSLLCFPLLAEEVMHNGSAKIYNGDKTHAKEQALKNALLQAVKQGVEKFLDTRTISLKYDVIKDQIYSVSLKYIRDYEIISEGLNLDGKFYEIQILAKVEEGKIQQKLKSLRILHERRGNKRLLVVYHSRTPDAVPRDNAAVEDALAAVQKTFAENSFRIFSEQTMKQVYNSLEQENLIGRPVDSLIAMALNHDADILVIMEMIAGRQDKPNKTFFKVKSTVHFSLYDTLTGQQIAETIVEGNEISVKKPNDNQWYSLLGKAGKQASLESVRQSTEHINHFFQNIGLMGQEYSVIFSGYSPQMESLIVNYLENTTDFRNLSELKNTFGFLEIELVSLKRKSTLRRKITSDLLELQIEVATKSVAGNQLIFINPNPMEKKTSTDKTSGVEETKAQVPPFQ